MAEQVGVYAGTPAQIIQLANNDNVLLPKGVPGRYYNYDVYGLQMTTAVVAGTADWLVSYPMYIARRTHFDRTAFRHGAAVAGSLMRYGIYDSDPITRQPRNLLHNFGEFNVAGGTAVVETNIDIWLEAGLYYTTKIQNSNKTFYVYGVASHISALGFADNVTYNQATGFQVAQLYGALPATTPAGGVFFYSVNGSFLNLLRVAV